MTKNQDVSERIDALRRAAQEQSDPDALLDHITWLIGMFEIAQDGLRLAVMWMPEPKQVERKEPREQVERIWESAKAVGAAE